MPSDFNLTTRRVWWVTSNTSNSPCWIAQIGFDDRTTLRAEEKSVLWVRLDVYSDYYVAPTANHFVMIADLRCWDSDSKYYIRTKHQQFGNWKCLIETECFENSFHIEVSAALTSKTGWSENRRSYSTFVIQKLGTTSSSRYATLVIEQQAPQNKHTKRVLSLSCHVCCGTSFTV